MAAASISLVPAAGLPARLGELAALLRACVEDGASIGFVLPFPAEEATAFWRGVAAAMARGTRLLLLAEDAGRIVGAAQLDIDTPANQPHRAEARKLMVHPDFRRRGVGRALMAELERQAAARGRRLITLDTRTGDGAEPLYRGLGYVRVGVIPGYCLDVTGARLDSTTIMYKAL